ncbi:MAG: UDP-N-acetylmuramoyl-tripeptide--D-alanyl-D-alanine ligase [Prevotellaceae bacterium]|jgi:UDP-N-acetylmuramoyl-tripeptide--D-alanyl-D-alanine ligase|nr:UDP-N-acetylmuramoyl-tripeptide--D-alanyl-D-alanine ligase [Prevotellaceae bacterium]
MIETLSYITFLCLSVYSILLLKKELHMMQLNGYFNARYFKWLKESGRKQYDGIRILIVLCCALPALHYHWLLPAGAMLLSGAGSFMLLKQKSKKKLDFTRRAVRLFAVTLLLAAALPAAAWLATRDMRYVAPSFALLAGFSFIIIILANTLAKPVERLINRWYVKDAEKKIRHYPDLTVIGVTGSYGKTSVKHFLQHILSERYHVLITPGSFNTTMGVVRTVREHLQPLHEVFIVEMGAKKTGDVQEICQIVRPRYGIITAVGAQHLETFGSLENVKKAKMELMAALPATGAGFINFDNCAPADIPAGAEAEVISFAILAGADYCAANIAYGNSGMSFDVYRRKGKMLTLETSLLGGHNVSNLLACAAVALEMGLEKYRIEKAVKSIRAVEHRLEIKTLPNGITVIDDAFNSNPVGSKMALEALKRVKGNRKIVITPGMIELGEKEYELNYAFGQTIASNSDIAVLVGAGRTRPIQDGIKSTRFPAENMMVCKNLQEANEYVKSIMQQGDVVLYENDLPDTFNE